MSTLCSASWYTYTNLSSMTFRGMYLVTNNSCRTVNFAVTRTMDPKYCVLKKLTQFYMGNSAMIHLHKTIIFSYLNHNS